LGLEASINTYIYAEANPIMVSDPSGLINYLKSIVSILNGIIGATNIGSGAAFVVTGAGIGATGVAAPFSIASIAYGVFKLNAGIAALRRAKQQFKESIKECPSDATFRNLLGLLPFGQNFDDKGETIQDYGQSLLNKPAARLIIELLTYGEFK